MRTEDLTEGVTDLAEGHIGLDRVQDEWKEVGPATGRRFEPQPGLRHRFRVTARAEPREERVAGRLDRRVKRKEAGGRRRLRHKLVDPHNDSGLRLQLLLGAVGRLLDLSLHERNGVKGAAHPLNLLDVRLRRLLDLVSESFHEIRPPEGVGGVGHP